MACLTPGFITLGTRSAAVKYTKSMHKIMGSRPVCNFFGIQELPVCTSTYQYKPVHTCMYLSVLVCTHMYWYALVHTSTSQYIQVCTFLYWYVLVHTSTSVWIGLLLHNWYESVWTRMYKYVLVHTSIFRKFWFLSYRPVRFWIRGGTRRYKAVPESPVPLDMEVQGSTWRYKALYRLGPPYPGDIQGYRTFWYCHVPVSIPEFSANLPEFSAKYQNFPQNQ